MLPLVRGFSCPTLFFLTLRLRFRQFELRLCQTVSVVTISTASLPLLLTRKSDSTVSHNAFDCLWKNVFFHCYQWTVRLAGSKNDTFSASSVVLRAYVVWHRRCADWLPVLVCCIMIQLPLSVRHLKLTKMCYPCYLIFSCVKTRSKPMSYQQRRLQFECTMYT